MKERDDMMTTEERMADLNKELPFSNEAEKGVLSCLLQDPETRVSEAKITLPRDVMYHYANRVIYDALLALSDKAVAIDPVTLTHALRDQDLLDKVGGGAAIAELFGFVPIPAHWPFYTKILKDKWMCRQILGACAEIMGMVHAHGSEGVDANANDLLSAAQEKIFGIAADKQEGDGGTEYREVILDVLDMVESQIQNVATIPAERVPFGFTDLDRRVWGFVRGQFVVLGARPSMGKSALAKDISGNVSRGEGHYREWKDGWPHMKRKRVLGFNLEMSNEQNGTRDLVGGAGLDLQAMRYGLPIRDAHDKLARRAMKIKDSNMRMYDRPGMSIQKMRAICRAQKRKHGLDLVVIDYLQLMHSETKRAQGNRQLEISEISAGLKEMAKELDCVVLALAQLGRSVEERADKTPILSDLRESGSIEQDADVVMFLTRPSYYDDEADKSLARLIVAKGRDVGIGEIELHFAPHLTTFSSTTEVLLTNNLDKREAGYESKPQACKQDKPAAAPAAGPVLPDYSKKAPAKQSGRPKWNGATWVKADQQGYAQAGGDGGQEDDDLGI